jgi:probable phosphoglycerate mutase
MIVTLLRHGSTAWNEQRRMQGRRDIPLSEQGRAEVRTWRLPADLAVSATGALQWHSSPLRRAVETAQILSGMPPRGEPALIEMDWGEWEGYGLDELRRRFGDAFAKNEAAGLDFRPPGGESPRDVRDRIVRWLGEVAAGGEPVVAVTHKGVLRAVLAAATGWDMMGKPPVRLRNDALHRFDVDTRGRIAVLECNVPLVGKPGIAAT